MTLQDAQPPTPPPLRASRRSAAALAVLVLMASGCGTEDDASVETASAMPAPTSTPRPAPSGSAPPRATVQMAAFEYQRDPVRIQAGGSVTWVNRDKAPHTSTDRAPAEAYDTGTVRTGARGRVTFDKPGSYRYYCVYHPFMEGTVDVVKERGTR